MFAFHYWHIVGICIEDSPKVLQEEAESSLQNFMNCLIIWIQQSVTWMPCIGNFPWANFLLQRTNIEVAVLPRTHSAERTELGLKLSRSKVSDNYEGIFNYLSKELFHCLEWHGMANGLQRGGGGGCRRRILRNWKNEYGSGWVSCRWDNRVDL